MFTSDGAPLWVRGRHGFARTGGSGVHRTPQKRGPTSVSLRPADHGSVGLAWTEDGNPGQEAARSGESRCRPAQPGVRDALDGRIPATDRLLRPNRAQWCPSSDT